MKTVQIKGMNVEIYDSIEDLPILRFHKYNKMLLVDAGVGSDLADFDRHIEKAIRYAASPTQIWRLRSCRICAKTCISFNRRFPHGIWHLRYWSNL